MVNQWCALLSCGMFACFGGFSQRYNDNYSHTVFSNQLDWPTLLRKSKISLFAIQTSNLKRFFRCLRLKGVTQRPNTTSQKLSFRRQRRWTDILWMCLCSVGDWVTGLQTRSRSTGAPRCFPPTRFSKASLKQRQLYHWVSVWSEALTESKIFKFVW